MPKVTKEGFEQYLREVDALVSSATAHQEIGNIQAASQLFAKANHLQRAWSNLLSNSLQAESSTSIEDFVGITRMTSASRRQRIKKVSKSSDRHIKTNMPPPWRSGGGTLGSFDKSTRTSGKPPITPHRSPSHSSKNKPSSNTLNRRNKTSHASPSTPAELSPSSRLSPPHRYRSSLYRPSPSPAQQADEEEEEDDNTPFTQGLDALDSGRAIVDQAWWHSQRHYEIKRKDLERYRSKVFGEAYCYGGRDWSGFFNRIVVGGSDVEFVEFQEEKVMDADCFYSMIRRVMRLSSDDVKDGNIAAIFHGRSCYIYDKLHLYE